MGAWCEHPQWPRVLKLMGGRRIDSFYDQETAIYTHLPPYLPPHSTPHLSHISTRFIGAAVIFQHTLVMQHPNGSRHTPMMQHGHYLWLRRDVSTVILKVILSTPVRGYLRLVLLCLIVFEFESVLFWSEMWLFGLATISWMFLRATMLTFGYCPGCECWIRRVV